MASGDYISSWLCRDLSSRNGCYLKYYYAGSNSASSYMSFGFHSQDDRLVITPSNYVGIGTTSPSYGLEVVSYGAYSIGSGVIYGWYGPGGSGQNQLGPINVQISILATQGVMTLNNYYARSDRRCKKHIRPIDSEYAASFVRDVAPSYYLLRSDDDERHPRIGYIAQHFRDYIDLLCFTENSEMAVEEEGDIEGVQLAVDYSRVCCLLHKLLETSPIEWMQLKKSYELIAQSF